ncbi:hypothetical protein [Providencia sneebia]|uniref:YspD n=1 Tax=Providencia sneebia DSM 19967 TaxID=1141660 RepID=K8WU07_9GAMM|nr:hypothetical protein [Providencia sneebia]EKT60902.1 YspD [Providencia sneebia DSM 19967]
MKLDIMQKYVNHQLNTLPISEIITDKLSEPLHFESSINLNSDVPNIQKAEMLLNELGYHVDDIKYPYSNDNLNYQKITQKAREIIREINLSKDSVNRVLKSINEPIDNGCSHIDGIKELILNIHSDYQASFGDVVKASTKYMEKINTELGKISNFIHSGKDGKVKFNAIDFAKSLDLAVSEYSGVKHDDMKNKHLTLEEYFASWDINRTNATPLFSIKGKEGEYAFWKRKLEGQGFAVEQDNFDSKKINIYPDFKSIKEILSSILKTDAWNGNDIQPQIFQTLQTGIDSQKNIINNNASRLLEVFRQDNNHFETIIQLLIQLLKDLQQYNNGFVNM